MTRALTKNAAFDRTFTALRAGNLNDAEHLLQSILREHPRHFAALNLLGIVLTQLGRFAEAETYIRSALDQDPCSEVTLYNYGIVLKALKRPAEALERFTQALAINPAVADTWNNRGTVFNDLGQHRDAIADFDRAIGLNPGLADAFCNKGKTLILLDRFDDAWAAFERALALKPNLAEAWLGRARILGERGQYGEALAAFDKALALKPGFAEASMGRGEALHRMKRYEDALLAFEKALAHKPEFAEAAAGSGDAFAALKRYDEALNAYSAALALKPDLARAWFGRGNLFYELKRRDEALSAYEQALALTPDLAEAWLGRGNVFYELTCYDAALGAYERALNLKPGLPEAWLGRANVFYQGKRDDDALACYGKALALKPELAQAWAGYGNALARRNDVAKALAAFDEAFALDPEFKALAGHRLFTKLRVCDWAQLDEGLARLLSAIGEGKPVSDPFSLLSVPSTPADQLQCARNFASDTPRNAPLWRGVHYSHDRIRIAYLSAQFHEHATAYLLAGLFEHHDRSRFEVTGISFGPDVQSEMRSRLKSGFEHFIDARDKSDQEIADIVRSSEIDIAVDLVGHTEDARLEILARRPAPVQVSYLGYLGTMGVEFIDYVIADEIALPSDQQEYYSEKIVHLPGCFVASERLTAAPDTPSRRDVGLPAEGFVFCSFNNSYKFSKPMFELWMRLLTGVEDSVLWLLESNAAMAKNLRCEAQRCGVDPERIIFAPRLPLSEHLARQRLADLFLDTTPYNAGATGAAALAAGLPLLTVIGDTFVGRMAASMLHAVGLAELVTESMADYEALALNIAAEPELCAALKDKLARNRETYPLFDIARFARTIEAAYMTMWRLCQLGEPPQQIIAGPPL